MLNQVTTASLDLMFQALADPTRRMMVDRLSRGPASVSELAKPFAMSLPAVVQHLQVLEQSGLVRSEKVGRVRTCTIDSGALSQAEKWINDRRIQWEHRLDRLGDFLAATVGEEG
ncbi:MAG: transcriptional regulator [Hyphomicrobiales bacterium]|nr:MAG: transcriptional regulator [Hyphomicrobiales bacterium]